MDSFFVTSNAGRLTRALFEMCLKRGMPTIALKMLTFCKMFDRRMWDFQHPLRQFKALKMPIIQKLEEKKLTLDRLCEMECNEIGAAIQHQKLGPQISTYASQIPYLHLTCSVQPITRKVLRVTLTITPDFQWSDKIHGSVEPWHIWVEDDRNEHVYHSEYFLLHKKKAREAHKLTFTIPIFEPLPPQYFLCWVSDHWLGSQDRIPISFQHLILPEEHPPHTALLDLHPLPLTVLHNPAAESMYSYTHMNPIQTQVFHTVYHTDENVLLGAPTGSGKTFVAELAILRLLSLHPGQITVYVAPLKALARERIREWGKTTSLKGKLGLKIQELTGDHTPDARALAQADVLITTPEKWDGISRSWRHRDYVQRVGLIIMDEIHLLGSDRGPVLEVIVSRMRYICTQTVQIVRVVGL
jgi:activating signal cointegrator complex subunit 3